jgi:hypothetical protein
MTRHQVNLENGLLSHGLSRNVSGIELALKRIVEGCR